MTGSWKWLTIQHNLVLWSILCMNSMTVFMSQQFMLLAPCVFTGPHFLYVPCQPKLERFSTGLVLNYFTDICQERLAWKHLRCWWLTWPHGLCLLRMWEPSKEECDSSVRPQRALPFLCHLQKWLMVHLTFTKRMMVKGQELLYHILKT